jgi:hypothetical protein
MPLWLFVRPVVLPLFEATVGNRPWIVASAGHPPVRMVWRAIGRGPASRAVDEIAEALARGETHPAPFASKWVGYDQGGVVMPPKS